MAEPIIIQVVDKEGKGTSLAMELFSPAAVDYVRIDQDEADKYSESRDQLNEGTEYEYEFKDRSLSFRDHPVVHASLSRRYRGTIRTGNYVGRLNLEVEREGACVGVVDLQVRSVKVGFREQYHQMLEDIAREAAELVMSSSEASYQKFEVDPSQEEKTRYEQFAFVRSLLQSDAFQAAIGRVCGSPIVAMKDAIEIRRTDSLRRMSRGVLRQLASSANRIELPEGHPLANRLPSLPRYVEVASREETVDVLENRFVKHVLTTFMNFAADIAKLATGDMRLRASANYLAEQLEGYLLDPLFRSVSELDRATFSSPALQRREGYREVLRIWLMFGMAAKIGWSGGEDVYQGGNRNIAVLYEYWAFFKLLKVVSGVFSIERKEREKLLSVEKKGLELALRRGRAVMLQGVYAPVGGRRPLNVRLHYNKTFLAEEDFTKAGSWTVDMRPDYTLSLWPKGLNESAAEQADAIVHVHFDAKYKIDKFKDIFEKDPNVVSHANDQQEEAAQEDLNKRHEEEEEGNYKRGDLLKMHSYNDAIRRTYGSYILYPGTGEEKIRRYREIIPGIGAFVLRPEVGRNESVGSVELKLFLQEVALSLQDRLTQHERMAKYQNLVHKDPPVVMSVEARKLLLPEINNELMRPFIPADESIVIGYYKGEEHFEWIRKNFYNIRLGDVNGALHVDPGVLSAQYVLLHGPGEAKATKHMFKIVPRKSRLIWSSDDFKGKGYPGGFPSGDNYLMFKLEEIKEGEPLYGGVYDITALPGFSSGRGSANPFATTFEKLLQLGVVSVVK